MKHMKWWGWGEEGVAFRYDDKPAFAAFIKNAIGSFAIIDSAIGFADQTGPRRGRIGLGHWETNSGQAPRMGEGKV